MSHETGRLWRGAALALVAPLVLTSVAGNGIGQFSGDGGPAALAGLAGPEDVAVNGPGDLLIADTGNDRIREVTP